MIEMNIPILLFFNFINLYVSFVNLISWENIKDWNDSIFPTAVQLYHLLSSPKPLSKSV
jgi:hypothetical protein